MPVKRIEFPNFNISIGISNPFPKASIRKEFVDSQMLNIYHPKMGNPVIEDLMDKVISNRSIPLDDGIETLKAIQEKKPYLNKYIEGWIKILNEYKKMI